MDKPVTQKPADCALPSRPEVKDDGWADVRKELYGGSKNCAITVIDKKAYVDCETENGYSHSKVHPMPLPHVDIDFEPIQDHKVPGHNPDDVVEGNKGDKLDEEHRC